MTENAVSGDDARWQLVLARQETSAGFVYAARTTGIYYRPICPSRRPLPVNVSFFDTTDAARAAGFRACLRCRPDERRDPAGESGGDLDRARTAVMTAPRTMLAHRGPMPAAHLRSLTGLSQRSLSRAFAMVAGTSAKAFGDAVCTGTARALLRAGHPVTDGSLPPGSAKCTPSKTPQHRPQG